MTWQSARARLAAAERHHPGSDTTELRRVLRAERLGEAIRREAEADPPLTVEQRSQLAVLLLSTSGGAAG